MILEELVRVTEEARLEVERIARELGSEARPEDQPRLFCPYNPDQTTLDQEESSR